MNLRLLELMPNIVIGDFQNILIIMITITHSLTHMHQNMTTIQDIYTLHILQAI